MCFGSRNEYSCWQTLLVFWGKKVTSQSNISFLFYWHFFSHTGKFNYSEYSFVLETHRILLPNFEPSLSHWISFFKSKEEGNTKSHCGEGSICLFWHEKSFFRIHLHLEVSSLWAFHLLYWLLLSCRKSFQGFNCRHPESVCASLIPKAPCDRGTVHLLSPGVTAQAQCAFSKALWGRSGASQVSVGCVCVGLHCPGLPKEWPEFICMFWSRARRFLLAQTPRSQSAPRDRMSEAEFINPLRVQLLVGSWEWEVFVCPKNSYPEERIIKAAPFGSVSKMASSSGYSW